VGRDRRNASGPPIGRVVVEAAGTPDRSYRFVTINPRFRCSPAANSSAAGSGLGPSVILAFTAYLLVAERRSVRSSRSDPSCPRPKTAFAVVPTVTPRPHAMSRWQRESGHRLVDADPAYLLMVAAAAIHTTSSCEPVPPEHPIAPMSLPPSISGMPPREAMTSSLTKRYLKSDL
jgi:hypothetical protein